MAKRKPKPRTNVDLIKAVAAEMPPDPVTASTEPEHLGHRMVATQLAQELADALFGPRATTSETPEEIPQATMGEGDALVQTHRGIVAALATDVVENDACGYWAEVSNVVRRKKDYFVIQLTVREGDIFGAEPKVLNLDALVTAVDRIVGDDKIVINDVLRQDFVRAWADEDLATNLDIEHTDIMIQVAVLGEIRYS